MDAQGEKTLKSLDKTYSAAAIKANTRVLQYCRILTSIGGGAVTGILGYTGLSGFLAYILFYILGSLLVLVRGGNGFSGSAWFASSSDFWTGGLSQGVMTFVLFWTLFYDIVHVY